MNNQIETQGEIRKGKLMHYGKDFVDDFCEKNTGKTALITIRVYEKGSSQAFIGYYRNKILPDLQRAYFEKGQLKTLEQIDKELRGSCPSTIIETFNEKTQAYERELINLNDLEQWQLTVFIDMYIRPWAAENLHVFIDNTQTL